MLAGFEVSAGTPGTGNCDSVYIYTVHMYGIGMNFTDENYTIRHSSYFNSYLFTPSVSFDTIQTSAGIDNEFYAFVPCGSPQQKTLSWFFRCRVQPLP